MSKGFTYIPGEFFIQDSRSSNDIVLWWKGDGHGYTTNLSEAGKFSEEEARRIERNRSTDKAVPCEVALDCSFIVVSKDRLREKTPNDSR